MKKRTVDEKDAEIDELDLEILDIKKSISEDGPDWREGHRKKTGDLAPGYVPLADRRKRIKLLESRIVRLKKDRAGLQTKATPTSGKRFGHGELKEKILQLAKRDGCIPGKTVPSKRILTWLKEIKRDRYTTTEGAIRAVLSTHGFSKEPHRKS